MTAFRPVALLAALSLALAAAAPAAAQPVPGAEPGVAAVGFGSASAPAASAELQFLLGSAQSFGMGGEVFVEEGSVDEGAAGEAAGTPGAEAIPTEGMGGPPRLTEDALAPVVAALVAAGAPEAGIAVTAPVANEMFGPGGPGIGEVRVTVDQPQADQLAGLVAAAYDAAPGAGLTVLHAGARYEAADCAALLQEAREAAIADARLRAEGLAQGLGVALGDLVQASETPYYGPVGGASCGPEGMEGYYGPYGAGTEAPFDRRRTEATAAVQVVLTFAIAGAGAGEPTDSGVGEAGSVMVAVVGADGAPVVGACLDLTGPSAYAACDDAEGDADPTAGVIELDAVAPGDYLLAVTAASGIRPRRGGRPHGRSERRGAADGGPRRGRSGGARRRPPRRRRRRPPRCRRARRPPDLRCPQGSAPTRPVVTVPPIPAASAWGDPDGRARSRDEACGRCCRRPRGRETSQRRHDRV